MTTKASQDAVAAFRKHLPDLSIPRFTTAKDQDAHEYAREFQTRHVPPWLFNLTEAWKDLHSEPYKGVTVDGHVKPGLYSTQDEGVDIDKIYQATEHLLGQLDSEQTTKIRYTMNASEWRAWSNPEFYLRPFGLRLDEIPEPVAESILKIIQATFSPEGYQKALAAMRINHFLGEVCCMPKVMNKYSYNFLLFGNPSTKPDESWGWVLYGHHLCLSVFLRGTQIVISPTFTGAEPNVIDEGRYAGTAILATEGDIGLQLMQSLPQDVQSTAQIYKDMYDPSMQHGNLKTDRWNQDDQRHLCGAFRDNRIVPYEGVRVSEMKPDQQQLVLDIVEQFVLYLPAKARELRKDQVGKHFEETYFSWIGGFGDDDAFYFRIQSPVIICEFDHHSGVFLTNKEPAKFHTHTIVRSPNAGDYGNAIRKMEDQLS